jgi:hypothetical protein
LRLVDGGAVCKVGKVPAVGPWAWDFWVWQRRQKRGVASDDASSEVWRVKLLLLLRNDSKGTDTRSLFEAI